MSYATEKSVILEINDRKLKRNFKFGDEIAVNLGVGKNTNVGQCYVIAAGGWRNKLNKYRDQKIPTADAKADGFAVAVRNYNPWAEGPERTVWVPAVVKPKRVICSWESWEKIYKEVRREATKSEADRNQRHEEECVKADKLREALERNGIEIKGGGSYIRIDDDNLDKLLTLIEQFEECVSTAWL